MVAHVTAAAHNPAPFLQKEDPPRHAVYARIGVRPAMQGIRTYKKHRENGETTEENRRVSRERQPPAHDQKRYGDRMAGVQGFDPAFAQDVGGIHMVLKRSEAAGAIGEHMREPDDEIREGNGDRTQEPDRQPIQRRSLTQQVDRNRQSEHEFNQQ